MLLFSVDMSRARLAPCAICRGFLPSRAEVCPHCKAPHGTKGGVLARLHLSALGGAVGGGALAMTLMACYGLAPSECEGCYDPDARSLADVQIGDAAASDALRSGATDAGTGDARADGAVDPDGGDAEADAAP
jgi:hypothetical protein